MGGTASAGLGPPQMNVRDRSNIKITESLRRVIFISFIPIKNQVAAFCGDPVSFKRVPRPPNLDGL
jgi:hypothetical protein